MGKENYLHSIALFLIFLILTIPFYTTSVYATINSVSVKGSAGIEGYAKKTDFLNFNVLAVISNNTVTKDQVVLGSNTKFDTCTGTLNNGSSCTSRFPSNGTEQFDSKAIPFTIKLFNSNGTLDDTKLSTVVIDNKAPDLKISVQQQKFNSKQNVVVNYDATDFACEDPSCSNKCVGLKSIDFNSSSSFRQTIAFNASNTSTSTCTASSSITIESKKFNEGENTLLAKATDKFDQTSQQQSVTFTVDTKGPTILANSFAIVRKGFSLSTYAPNPVPVDIFINVSADDLDENSIVADLSVLNPSQKNVKAECTLAHDDLYACKWSIDLNPTGSQNVVTGSVVSNQTNTSTSKPKNIVINASDTSGNVESASISKALILDDKGPVALSLSTEFEIDGKPFARGSGNTITAIFDEATGLIAADVFLHAGSNLAATKCSSKAPWTCEFQNVNFGSVKKSKMSIESDTIDILGNAVSESKTVDVIVDSQAPVLTNMDITAVGGATEAPLPDIFKVGDKIAVVANVAEENQLTAVADFSKFVKDASNVEGSCSKNASTDYICSWITDAINIQADAVIIFNFSDAVGNSLVVAKSLKSLGLETSAAPDFWKNTVTCSPQSIDRSLGPLINQRLFCEVKLEPNQDSPSTLLIQPATCTDDSSILQSVETIHNEPGSTTPFLIITLKKSDFNINEAKLACSFNIKSRIGDLVTQNPEIETANINVPFYNLPLGELSDELKRKIKDAKSDAEGIWDIIGLLNKLVFYAKKICQLFGTLYNIIAILYTVTQLLKGNTDIICDDVYTIYLCPVAFSTSTNSCNGQQTAREGGQKGWQDYGQKFCKFVNCKWAPGVIGQWQEYLAGQINRLPASSYLPQGGSQLESGLAQYLNPQTNLITAVVFVCLPGIIYSLDKYRQIKCLYADCLFNAVGKEGLPITACEDEKAYATCKYIVGELFALIPWTAALDHFLGIIKEALSNPFSALGVGIALLCRPTCPAPSPPSTTAPYLLCETAKLFSTLGQVIGEVKDIIDNGFRIRTDYCKRLDNINVDSGNSTSTAQTNTTQ